MASVSLTLASAAAFATDIGDSIFSDDFEAGIPGWVSEGLTGGVSASADAFAGSGALQFDYAQDFHGARFDFPLNQVDRLGQYEIGLVYKEAASTASSTPGLRVAIGEFGPSGVTFHNGDFLFANPLWQAGPPNTIQLTRPDANNLSLFVQGHSTPGGGSVLIDNLTLTKSDGQVHAQEPFLAGGGFEYTQGSELGGQNPPVAGFYNPWAQESNASGQTSSAILAESLSYTDSLGNSLQNSGGAAEVFAADEPGGGCCGANSYFRVIDTGPTSPFHEYDPNATGFVNDGVFYMSFLMEQSATTESPSHGAYLKFNTEGTTRLRIGHRDDVGYVLGTTDADTDFTQQELDPSQADDTSTQLFVVKFDLDANSFSDSATVWIDPDLGLGADPAGGVTLSGEEIAFNRLFFENITTDTEGLSLRIDELRFGDTFADVTPIAQQLLGDYNADGIVNAADYTVWRDNLGGDAAALNGNGTGGATVVQADYDLWASQFGSGASASLAVPEPQAAVTLLSIVLILMHPGGMRRYN